MAAEVSRISPSLEQEVAGAQPAVAVELEAAATCASCRFYLARRIHHAAEPLGQCRRHAAGPIVQASDWCGDFEERV